MRWTYIGQVERGERNLTLKSIQSIARALDLNISELFRGLD
jgi:transcriptional regulator with XRE-family HTH domain